MMNFLKPLAIFLLFICLAFLIFGITINYDFVFDDVPRVKNNEFIKQPSNFFKIFTSYYAGETSGVYRPVTVASFSLNYFLFGIKPWSYHLINIILHIINSWLLFLLLKKISKQKYLPILSSLLFLVLPIHTEAVVGIIGRAELLGFGFSLLCFILLIKNKSKSRLKIGLACLFLLSGLLSKETAMAVIPIFFCLVVFDFRNYIYSWLSLVFTFLIYFLIRILVLGENLLTNNATLVENPLKFVTIKERVLTGFKVLYLYLQKTLLGTNLSSDYSYNQITMVDKYTDLYTSAGVFISLVFLILICWPFFKRSSSILTISLAGNFFWWPYLLISNLGWPIGTIMGERLMYFPSAGICIFLALFFLFIKKLKPSKIFNLVWLIIFIFLIFFYSYASYDRSLEWKDEKTLFKSAAIKSPNSVLSRSNLGAMHILDREYVKAEQEILIANKIYPHYPHAVNNLGLIYLYRQDYDSAEKQFLKTLKVSPQYSNAYENLALTYFYQRKYKQAKDILLKYYFGDNHKAEFFLKELFTKNIKQAVRENNKTKQKLLIEDQSNSWPNTADME